MCLGMHACVDMHICVCINVIVCVYVCMSTRYISNIFILPSKINATLYSVCIL